VEGEPVRVGMGLAGTLAVIERLLDILATLHGAGVAHGGIEQGSLVRRADGLLLLTDFAPAPAQPTDDLAAVARLTRTLCADPLPPALASLLSRLEASDASARPTAAAAREAIHQQRTHRAAANPGFHLPSAGPQQTPGSRRLVFLGLLAMAAAGWLWWQHHSATQDWSATGLVTHIEGPAPTTVGTACTVEVTSAREGLATCRIEVVCGDVLVFGGGEYGLARCAGQPPRAQDDAFSAEDGDPALELLADQGTLKIWDQRHVEWRVSIDLDVEEGEE